MLNLFLKGVLTFLSIMTFGPYAADKQTARLFSVNYLCLLIIDIGSHEFIDHAIRYMLGT